MTATKRVPTHPGEVLLLEFLEPLGCTQRAFARHVGLPLQRVNEIVRGRRGVTPDTAWRFAQAFGTTPNFWLQLQAAHDLAAEKPKTRIARLKPRVAERTACGKVVSETR
jgi:addiction module HigA family antidote